MATAELGQAKYISLVTFRRDGREVATPIWVVGMEGRLFGYTRSDVGKVRRIRANGKIRMAPCSMTGKVLGDWVDGSATIVSDPALEKRFYVAMRKKYGLSFLLVSSISAISGKINQRTVLEFTPGQASPPARS